jgi:hypothetical protein
MNEHIQSISEDFSLERAVAELVEGLESQRTNAQLWSIYLEFSSWHMSSTELHLLCSAALKNAHSYDLFWTVDNHCFISIEYKISRFVVVVVIFLLLFFKLSRSSIYVRMISMNSLICTLSTYNRNNSIINIVRMHYVN